MKSERSQHIILYDDQCPLCTFQMKLLTWLDWFNVLRLAPVSDAASAGLAPQLTRTELLEAIHCISRQGRIYRGARCIRFIGFRLPLLVPLSLVLWVPGVIWIAEKVYAWVSRNRHLLSRWFGCKEACAIFPERRREGQEKLVPQKQQPLGP